MILGIVSPLRVSKDVKPASVYPFDGMKVNDKKAGLREFLADHTKTNPNQPLCFIFNTNRPHTPYPTNTQYKPEDMIIPPDMLDTLATREMLTRYYTEISEMDKQVGACLADVDAVGLKDKTVFIYTSDQGGSFPRAKWNLYDAGIRMPFIVRWPGRVKAGTVTQSLASSVDILPTFIEIAGGVRVDSLHGRSFLPTLMNPDKKHHEKIFATHTGNPLHTRGYNDYAMRAVRTDKHKYVLNLDPDKRWYSHCTDSDDKDTGVIYRTWIEKAKTDQAAAELIDKIHHRLVEELYDLDADPYELNNLAGAPDHQKILKTLRAEVVQWRQSLGDEGEPLEALMNHLFQLKKKKREIKPEYLKYLSS